MSKCECGSSANCGCQTIPAPGTAVQPFTYPHIFEPLGGTPNTNETVTIPVAPYELLVDTHDVMAPGRMDTLMHEFFAHLMSKCQRKNKAYAETDVTSDALNNFREAAGDYDISMMKYASILQGKHVRALKTWIRTGEAPDKPYRILGDIIVYAFLMYCISVDQGTFDHEEVLEDDD